MFFQGCTADVSTEQGRADLLTKAGQALYGKSAMSMCLVYHTVPETLHGCNR